MVMSFRTSMLLLRLMKLTFKIILLFLIIGTSTRCSSTSTLSKDKIEAGYREKSIIGTWKKTKVEDADSIGNILKDVPKFEFNNPSNSDGEPNRKKALDWINLTSSGEGFLLYDSLRVGLGFVYTITDSILTLGDSKYKVITLNDDTLQILKVPGLISLFGTYDLTTWTRVDKIEIKSTRLELLNLIKGEWSVDHIQNVKTSGQAMFNERVIIIDTLGTRQNVDAYFKFNESKFELGRYSMEVSTTFEYNIADSVINIVSGVPLYSILEIEESSMSLLGPLLAEQEEQSISIWKMTKVIKQ